MLLEWWSFGVQVVVTRNTGLAEVEAVTIFNSVHVVTDVMADLRLQFADQPLEHAHFDNRHESGIFQGLDVPRDGREMMVKAGKAPVCPELAFKMMSSQVCLPER